MVSDGEDEVWREEEQSSQVVMNRNSSSSAMTAGGVGEFLVGVGGIGGGTFDRKERCYRFLCCVEDWKVIVEKSPNPSSEVGRCVGQTNTLKNYSPPTTMSLKMHCYILQFSLPGRELAQLLRRPCREPF